MRKLITVILLLSISFVSLQAQKGKSYVIGFYNLENLFDTYHDDGKNDYQFLPDGSNNWTEAKYEKKLKNMATVIRSMRDDNKCWHTVLGISEVENRHVIDDLVNQPEIADANYQIVHYDGPDRRGVDVAMLYDPRKFQFLDSESIPFSFDNDPDNKMDSTEMSNFRTRDILMAHGKIDGEDVAIYVAHLPSRLGGKNGYLRSRGAKIIYEHSLMMMDKYPGIKIAVMGDMNDDPTDKSMDIYMHGRKDIDKVGEKDFFNPFYQMYKDGYGSLCYRGTWCIYDQVLVNYNLVNAPEGSLRIRTIVKNKYYGRVYNKPFMTQQEGQYKGTPFRTFSNGAFVGGYSDHYPTYIVVTK